MDLNFLPHRKQTPEELQRERDDSTWHRYHEFVRGWRWRRNGLKPMDVGSDDLKRFGLLGTFPNAPEADIEKMVDALITERAEQMKHDREDPYQIPIMEISSDFFSDQEAKLLSESKPITEIVTDSPIRPKDDE